MKKTLVVVMAGGKGERLEPLTRDRTKPAVPFGGIYRIIDFTLSNALNSNFRKIIVLVQYKCNSLNRHLRDGWNFLSPELGEYVETIPPQQRIRDTWYLGTADSVYQNIYSIEKENPAYVIILAGDHVYKMNYAEMLASHIEKNADVTVGAVPVPSELSPLYGIIGVDSSNRITAFQEKPHSNPITKHDNPKMCLASMGIYIFTTSILYETLVADAKNEKSTHDFGRDIVPGLLGKKQLYVYPFTDSKTNGPGYWRDVGTIDAYYMANMDLVSVSPEFNLYEPEWPIYTYRTPAPPPKFVFAQEGPDARRGTALDSLVSQGSIISGGRVERCIISPNVRVNSYSNIFGSILFEGVDVGRRAKIKNAIIDKNVKIPAGMEIGYDLEKDRKRFAVSEGGIVVIAKEQHL
ncbi:MAG: glucose-1-phosphate adenylyltransferase [Planctomycetes bacterium]|nr:glucose-1-phosphate adenylyltransferase [Planctomycetota bacterium]